VKGRPVGSITIADGVVLNPWDTACSRHVNEYEHVFSYTDQLEALYPDLDVPFRVLWGEADGWVPLSQGQWFAGMTPGAELHVLPDAGHFSMVDCPGLFAREPDGFLASVTAIEAARAVVREHA